SDVHLPAPSFPTRRSSDLPQLWLLFRRTLELHRIQGLFCLIQFLPHGGSFLPSIPETSYSLIFSCLIDHRSIDLVRQVVDLKLRSEEHTSGLQSPDHLVCR